MNLIAAAASFGVLVAIFQWGWGLDLLGLGKEGPINAFLPVIMLSLLFGLSMDYQVFLVSRMHEEWVHTKDNARAVRVGLAETSRVINSAALIMVCVFLAFVLSGDTGAAMAGVGLAAAVALDAFILRTALVPAAMHLLGKSNWWLPAGLEKRLPHLAVEPKEDGSGPPPAAASAGATVVHGFVRDGEGAPGRRRGHPAALEGRPPARPRDVPGGRLVHRLGPGPGHVSAGGDGSLVRAPRTACGRDRRTAGARRGVGGGGGRRGQLRRRRLSVEGRAPGGLSAPGRAPQRFFAGSGSAFVIPGRKSVNSSCTSWTRGRRMRKRARETPRAVRRAPRSASR